MTSKSAPKHTNNKLRGYYIMKSYHEEEKLPIMKNMAKRMISNTDSLI